MFDLLLNALFTGSACLVVMLTIRAVRRRLVPTYANFRGRFLLLSLIVISLKIAYVASFLVIRSEQALSYDEYRYLTEIRQIAVAPWEWNPILGTGPNYQATPKMGMSYVYGLILFVHGAAASAYTIMVINIVISYLTCAVVFLLTLRVSAGAIPALTAMFLTAVYPETLFWNARVLRENLTLLLVTTLVYVAIRLFQVHRPRHVAYLLASMGLLLFTRAQLALFLPLIFAYYAGVLFVRARPMKRLNLMPTLVLLGSVTTVGFELIRQQIQAVGGRRLFFVLQLGPSLLDRFSANIGSVLSLAARQEHGSLGVALVPFTAVVFMLLIATLLRFRRIFADRSVSAGLLVFLIVFFIVGLAIMELPNIRYRSTVAPLELSLVSVACYYYWRTLRLPRIALLPVRRD